MNGTWFTTLSSAFAILKHSKVCVVQWLQDVDASRGDAAHRLDVEEAELMTLFMPLYSLGSLESVLGHHKEKKVGVPILLSLFLSCRTCRSISLEHGTIEASLAFNSILEASKL